MPFEEEKKIKETLASVATVGVPMTTNVKAPASDMDWTVDTIQLEDDQATHQPGGKKWAPCSKQALIFFTLSGLVLIAISVGLAFAFAGRDSIDKDGLVDEEGVEKLVARNYEERFVEFRTVLSSNSDPTTFSSPDSPQSKALNWLVYKDETVDDDEVDRLLQRYAIMVVYFACSGEDWIGFVTPLDQQYNVNECSFFGMECDSSGAIVKLDLRYQRLAGQIPEELGLLTKLTWLDLSDNFLEGSIPEVIYTKLTDLEVLFLQINKLSSTISPEIGNMKSLESLDLGLNYLTGTVPVELMQLSGLKTLVLGFNDLSGRVLDLAVHLPLLEAIDIQRNDFTGPIPSSIVALTSLINFMTSETYLSGPLPTSFTDLTNLEILHLDSKELNCTIPEDIWKLSNLKEFVMYRSQAKGTIPTTVGQLSNLMLFELGRMPFYGSIPSEIAQLQNLLQFSLESTAISGTLPREFADLPNLEYVFLKFNSLHGDIDPLCRVMEMDYDCKLSCSCCAATCTGCGNEDGVCDSEKWEETFGDTHGDDGKTHEGNIPNANP